MDKTLITIIENINREQVFLSDDSHQYESNEAISGQISQLKKYASEMKAKDIIEWAKSQLSG
jgi:hypothetical protein